jgi:hypothetical protein
VTAEDFGHREGRGLTAAMLKHKGWSGGRTQLARMAFPRGCGGGTTVEGRRRVALLGSMPTEDSTHQAYHAAGGGKQRAPRVRPGSGCLRLERAWRMASRGSGGTKVLGKSKVPGEPNEKSNRGSHEGPDRCEASPPKHECEHLSARSETPFCVTAVCVCVATLATSGRGAVLIASMPAGAAPGPGGKSFLSSIQVTAFAGRSVDRRVPRDPTRPVLKTHV